MAAKQKKKTTKKPQKKASASKSRTRKSVKEPQTMDELLEAHGTQIQSLSRGDKVQGEILEITSKRVVLDIGGKSEGVVAEKAYTEAKDFIKTLKVGDEVNASVIIPETFDGITILSFRQAAQDSAWQAIDEAKKKDTPLVVVARSINPSGLVVDVEGIQGFVPTSQLGKEASKNPSNLINRHFKAKVLEADREENKVVLSERSVSDAEDIKLAQKALAKVKVGEVYEGVVTTLANFGCFVKFMVPVTSKKKVPLEGLVHISELSWDRVANPRDVISEDDKVKFRVIGIDGNKLSLSIKQAQEDPWDKVAKKYKKDKRVKGKVVKISDFGVFVQLEKGVEGLIHITKIPPGEKMEIGKSVNVYVEEVDQTARKISLGLVLTAKPVGYK